MLSVLLVVALTNPCWLAQADRNDAPPPENASEALGPGTHGRSLTSGELRRTYLLHLPDSYDSKRPAPVVLALHGAGMNGRMMVWFSGLTEKAEEAGFVVVYPNGTGVGPLLTWNAGGWRGKTVDDVAFIRDLLDDLATVVNVDDRRIYACGMSNGGMMCYRLAAELSDRIAAIAPVAGTMTIDDVAPKRPVPIIHFHGTKDNLVPFDAASGRTPRSIQLKGVEESVRIWVERNGCGEKPEIDTLSKRGEEPRVIRRTYGACKQAAEVVLIVIEDGGHTWPGQKPPVGFIGKSAMNISANDLMWEFFQRHPLN